MTDIALIAALVLVLVMAAALLRVVMGPGDADRMLGVQLLGTSLAGLALVLAIALELPRLLDLALVVAVLASVTCATFVSLVGKRGGDAR